MKKKIELYVRQLFTFILSFLKGRIISKKEIQNNKKNNNRKEVINGLRIIHKWTSPQFEGIAKHHTSPLFLTHLISIFILNQIIKL